MTTKIQTLFQNCSPGKPAYIPFVMAGDPNRGQSMAIIQALAQAGADLIEIGVPFSDPVADGIVIQQAAERALKYDTQLEDVLNMVRDLRAEGLQTPLLLFSYLNPIYQMGLENFAARAKASGVDGVLIVDLPPEEAGDYCKIMADQKIDTVFLASPTTSDERLKLIAQSSTGFVYYVSRAGVTGAQAQLPTDLVARLAAVRQIVTKPLCVGFGISTPAHAAALRPYVDGIVVGSAVVAMIESMERNKSTIPEIQSFFQSLKD